MYFITTRVRNTDGKDWVKLNLPLRYIRQTINMPLILRTDILTIIKWWVDASYDAHPDMRGHTRATMSFGIGSITGIAKNRKINAESSTEEDIIDDNDAL